MNIQLYFCLLYLLLWIIINMVINRKNDLKILCTFIYHILILQYTMSCHWKLTLKRTKMKKKRKPNKNVLKCVIKKAFHCMYTHNNAQIIKHNKLIINLPKLTMSTMCSKGLNMRLYTNIIEYHHAFSIKCLIYCMYTNNDSLVSFSIDNDRYSI